MGVSNPGLVLLNVTLYNNIKRGEENGHLFSDGLHFCRETGKRIKMLILLYSRTSRKRPPKLQRLSGRLREVLVYKNRTTGGLFREKVLK